MYQFLALLSLFLISLVVFIFGLIIGSFLNCVIYRLEINKSFLKGRSFCPDCQHTLNWQDLFPVFSFIILKGRCRYCQKKISWQYPLVEIATGLLFLLIFNFQLPIFNYFIVPFFIAIFVYDLKHYIIPDKIVYPAVIIMLIFNLQFLISKQFSIFNSLILSAVGAAAFFLAIVLISRGKWMGVGDIKLAFLMGLVLGYPNILVSLFLAFLTGAIIGIGLIAFNKKTLKSAVPFGPFLVIGALVAMFFGGMIADWYFNFFI
ncbi:MAG: prepilin peptidase [Candidatus Nealsonbacteria bacterium]|nr:prepilin peptidase [Candidatus Nealsonbacteria bacterium]